MSQSTLSRAAQSFEIDPQHSLEHAVRKVLMHHPGIGFTSLTVHRIQGGVCLEGVVKVEPDSPSVREIVETVLGIETVIDRLVVHTIPATPK